MPAPASRDTRGTTMALSTAQTATVSGGSSCPPFTACRSGPGGGTVRRCRWWPPGWGREAPGSSVRSAA